MYIVHVHIHIKPEFIEAFKAVSLENARNSLHEPGVVRFDVLQQPDDTSRFVLVEIYRTSRILQNTKARLITTVGGKLRTDDDGAAFSYNFY